MDISSRTPEGEPNSCDICGYEISIEPSLETRDATCPNCGALVWFDQVDEARIARIEKTARMKIRDRVFYLAIEKFGWPITTNVTFIGYLPTDDGSAWRRALEAARDWKEFAAML